MKFFNKNLPWFVPSSLCSKILTMINVGDKLHFFYSCCLEKLKFSFGMIEAIGSDVKIIKRRNFPEDLSSKN